MGVECPCGIVVYVLNCDIVVSRISSRAITFTFELMPLGKGLTTLSPFLSQIVPLLMVWHEIKKPNFIMMEIVWLLPKLRYHCRHNSLSYLRPIVNDYLIII